MSKNYCSEHEVKQNITKKVTCHEKMQAFLDYLRRPKTVFDLKDRTKSTAAFSCHHYWRSVSAESFFLNF